MAEELYGQEARMVHDLKVARDSYRTAEIYYAKLKNKFINQLPSLKQEVGAQAYRNIAQSVNAYLQNFDPNKIINTDRQKEIETFIANKANVLLSELGGVGDTLREEVLAASKRQKKNYGDDTYSKIANLSTNLREWLNSYFDAMNLKDWLQEQYLHTMGRQGGGASIQALYGLLRRQIIGDVLSGQLSTKYKASAVSYLNIFKGDFTEDIGEDAINSYKQDIAQKIGAEIVGGRQPMSDLIIGAGAKKLVGDKLKKAVKNLESLNSSITLQRELLNPEAYQYFGGQVKSWYPPGATNVPSGANQSYHPIGSRAEIYNAYGFGTGAKSYERGWHYSAAVLGLNILKVLGAANVFYITGNQFYWTTDLIKAFREAKYYLTFYYHRKANVDNNNRYDFTYPGTPEVVWQQEKTQLKKRIKKIK